MYVRSAVDDLSCYITMQSHCLQEVGRESLTITILANYYSSMKGKAQIRRRYMHTYNQQKTNIQNVQRTCKNQLKRKDWQTNIKKEKT